MSFTERKFCQITEYFHYCEKLLSFSWQIIKNWYKRFFSCWSLEEEYLLQLFSIYDVVLEPCNLITNNQTKKVTNPLRTQRWKNKVFVSDGWLLENENSFLRFFIGHY